MLVAVAFIMVCTAFSQTVYQPLRHPVYDFLDRIEARYGTEVMQFSRPLAREDIADALARLSTSGAVLRPYDRDELAFYRREFAEELARMSPEKRGGDVPEPRWNLVRLSTDTPTNTFLAADLYGRLSYAKRENADDVLRRSNGVQIYGYVGDHLGAMMRWHDNGVDGIPYDKESRRVPGQGIVKGPGSGSSYQFEVAEGQFTYSTPWLEAGVEKMDRWLGSGRAGAIVLSDKAPSFPTAGFRIRLTDWLDFEYFHAWLFSDIQNEDITVQRVYDTKYLAEHFLTARPLRGLQIAAGESIVYGGDLNIIFFIPVISFRAADRWTRAVTGNSQFFADVRYTPLHDLTVYASGFIDELDLHKVLAFHPSGDYHVAYTVGAYATDALWPILPLASETRLEFSRVYPYTYTNPNPLQWYTSHSVYMGLWTGPNSDLLSISHTVHPARGIDATVALAYERYGESDVSVPLVRGLQNAFLYGYEYSQRTISFEARWTPIHDLTFSGAVRQVTKKTGPSYLSSPVPAGVSIEAGASYSVY